MAFQATSSHSKPNVYSKTDRIREGLEKTVSLEAKSKVEEILNEVSQLSDVQKLLLYLQLPAGAASCSKQAQSTSHSRPEHIHALTWLKTHLQPDAECSVPKQEVYEEYRDYCEKHDYKALPQQDFSRLLRSVVPDVKMRRLGHRGHSKQCYSGVNKIGQMASPLLPNIDIPPAREESQESSSNVQKADDEVLSASWKLVFEWAKKLLNASFDSAQDLAEYLVTNQYVNGRSTAAFTILAASQKVSCPPQTSIQQSKCTESSITTTTVSLVTTTTSVMTGSSRHREAQLQLQRKLHEKEMLKEQKKRMEEQRSQLKDGTMDTAGVNSPSHSDGAAKHDDLTRKSDVTPEKKKSNQKPMTPQKLILPKTLQATPGTSNVTVPLVSQGSVSMSVAGGLSQVPAVTATTQQQQILLLSPSTPSIQPLFIVSPVQPPVVKGSAVATGTPKLLPVAVSDSKVTSTVNSLSTSQVFVTSSSVSKAGSSNPLLTQALSQADVGVVTRAGSPKTSSKPVLLARSSAPTRPLDRSITVESIPSTVIPQQALGKYTFKPASLEKQGSSKNLAAPVSNAKPVPPISTMPVLTARIQNVPVSDTRQKIVTTKATAQPASQNSSTSSVSNKPATTTGMSVLSRLADSPVVDKTSAINLSVKTSPASTSAAVTSSAVKVLPPQKPFVKAVSFSGSTSATEHELKKVPITVDKPSVTQQAVTKQEKKDTPVKLHPVTLASVIPPAPVPPKSMPSLSKKPASAQQKECKEPNLTELLAQNPTPVTSQVISRCTTPKQKGRALPTPGKSKFSGKRVSDLLKEKRGYGPKDDVTPYVNDRRPVCQLLKKKKVPTATLR